MTLRKTLFNLYAKVISCSSSSNENGL